MRAHLLRWYGALQRDEGIPPAAKGVQTRRCHLQPTEGSHERTSEDGHLAQELPHGSRRDGRAGRSCRADGLRAAAGRRRQDGGGQRGCRRGRPYVGRQARSHSRKRHRRDHRRGRGRHRRGQRGRRRRLLGRGRRPQGDGHRKDRDGQRARRRRGRLQLAPEQGAGLRDRTHRRTVPLEPHLRQSQQRGVGDQVVQELRPGHGLAAGQGRPVRRHLHAVRRLFAQRHPARRARLPHVPGRIVRHPARGGLFRPDGTAVPVVPRPRRRVPVRAHGRTAGAGRERQSHRRGGQGCRRHLPAVQRLQGRRAGHGRHRGRPGDARGVHGVAVRGHAQRLHAAGRQYRRRPQDGNVGRRRHAGRAAAQCAASAGRLHVPRAVHVREQGRQALLQRGELGTGQVHPDHEADRPRGLLHLRQELPHRQQGQPQPWRRHVLGHHEPQRHAGIRPRRDPCHR